MLPLSRYRVTGRSMEPNFFDGDYVIAFSYIFNKPKIGDVIVFKKGKMFLIKRIEKAGDIKIVVTRRTGAEMAFIRVEDGTGSLDLIVFPKIFLKTRNYTNL